ncbi:MAG: MATE family efflux transporter [Bacteroidota bacterium]|nr:MATE family efflux transporter [Bacteroidota bacterium]
MKDFTHGNETSLILKFSIPLVLGNLIQNLYSIIDSIIVGNFLGKAALAAVGASFPIIYTLISLVIGIGSGASTIIAQYFGAKDHDKVRKTIDTIYIFFFFAGIVISIIGIMLSRHIFILLRLPEEVMPDALIYLRIYLAGMIFLFGFNGISSILRGLGDSKNPLWFMIIAVTSNIILDLLFILVFKWEIAGIASAMVISQSSTFIASIIYLNKKHPLVSLKLKSLTFDRVIFKDCVRIGLPTGLQQSLVAIGMMSIMGIINTFGTNAVAAFTAGIRIDSFARMPAMTFASALQSFTGQNLGARKSIRIKKGLYSTLIISCIYCLFISAILVLTRDTLMRMFTSEESVIRIGSDYLLIVTSFYLLFSIMFAFYGIMRGAGATLIPMLVTLITLWIIRVPLAFYLSGKIGVNGIFWSEPISWIPGVLFCWIYYIKGNWKQKGVIKSDFITLPPEN